MTAHDARARRFAGIDERACRAYLEGAAEEWQLATGRSPTEDELRRILARYPGDPMLPTEETTPRAGTGQAPGRRP